MLISLQQGLGPGREQSRRRGAWGRRSRLGGAAYICIDMQKTICTCIYRYCLICINMHSRCLGMHKLCIHVRIYQTVV